MAERWTFEGGEWIQGPNGERIAQVYNWARGYLERGELIAKAPQLEEYYQASMAVEEGVLDFDLQHDAVKRLREARRALAPQHQEGQHENPD